MKRVLIIALTVLPFLLAAQNNCGFFENVDIKTNKTQINTPGSDFGPAFVNSELWYSAFSEEEIGKLAEGKTKDVYYNIFVTPIDAKGNLLEGKSTKLADISNGHMGPVSYCKTTKELFVTISNFENPIIRNNVYQKADIRLKIIVLKEINGEWQKTDDFPYNDPTYSVAHPSVSITGDTLFFVSNMSGKESGETDIYMSVKRDNEWDKPINLGNKVNTSSNEMFPVIFRNNMLVYSSKGLGDGEDLDFYYTCFENNGFSTPKPLIELNSDSDDFGLTIHQNQEIGYFTSNRPDGEGDDDIYKVEFEGRYDLELIVMDSKTMLPIPNARVNFDDGIIGTLAGVLIKRILKKNSSYTVTSNVNGYINNSKTITTIGKPFGTIKDTLLVDKAEIGLSFVMENIFYDLDKWEILPESEPVLNQLVKLMNENPDWKVELGSHTDSRGSNRYNKRLSKKRSNSAVKYISTAGIAKDRIIAKGYGETMLINECTDGVDCTEAEHRKNRRTEFKIIEME